jgi:hypothetical protein
MREHSRTLANTRERVRNARVALAKLRTTRQHSRRGCACLLEVSAILFWLGIQVCDVRDIPVARECRERPKQCIPNQKRLALASSKHAQYHGDLESWRSEALGIATRVFRTFFFGGADTKDKQWFVL